jgi:hypothetical protein
MIKQQRFSNHDPQQPKNEISTPIEPNVINIISAESPEIDYYFSLKLGVHLGFPIFIG